LRSELDHHLEVERNANLVNRSNGIPEKTVLTGNTQLTLTISRDRERCLDLQRVEVQTLADI